MRLRMSGSSSTTKTVRVAGKMVGGGGGGGWWRVGVKARGPPPRCRWRFQRYAANYRARGGAAGRRGRKVTGVAILIQIATRTGTEVPPTAARLRPARHLYEIRPVERRCRVGGVGWGACWR